MSKKYDRYEKGLLSHEVSQALQYWLALHTDTQTELIKKVPNPTPKVQIIFAECKNYLLGRYYDTLKSGQHIPIVHIEHAITSVRGSDKRTINRWLQVFSEQKLIRPLTKNVVEIM